MATNAFAALAGGPGGAGGPGFEPSASQKKRAKKKAAAARKAAAAAAAPAPAPAPPAKARGGKKGKPAVKTPPEDDFEAVASPNAVPAAPQDLAKLAPQARLTLLLEAPGSRCARLAPARSARGPPPPAFGPSASACRRCRCRFRAEEHSPPGAPPRPRPPPGAKPRCLRRSGCRREVVAPA